MDKKSDINLLGNIPEVHPSKDFSKNIMLKVQPKKKASKIYRPVISRFIRYSIASCFFILILFSAINQSDTHKMSEYNTLLIDSLKFFEKVYSPLFTFSLFSIFFLLAFEKIMSKFYKLN